jgi:hypothetical protein
MSNRPIDPGAPEWHAAPRLTAIWALLAIVLALFMPAGALAAPGAAALDEPPPLTPRAYLAVILSAPKDACPATSAAHFDVIPVLSPPTDRPAAQHADLNLALRGYETGQGFLGLVDYGGGTDPEAPPQFGQIFDAGHVYTMTGVYQVYDWNWPANSRAELLPDPPVTLLALQSKPGEAVRIPSCGKDIYQGIYRALVLYAEERRITLKYTRTDNVVAGYTVHLENVCVDPNLLALYRESDSRGRASLPALRNDETLGVAAGGEILVAVRDTGTFMDPRSRKDWWTTAP